MLCYIPSWLHRARRTASIARALTLPIIMTCVNDPRLATTNAIIAIAIRPIGYVAAHAIRIHLNIRIARVAPFSKMRLVPTLVFTMGLVQPLDCTVRELPPHFLSVKLRSGGGEVGRRVGWAGAESVECGM